MQATRGLEVDRLFALEKCFSFEARVYCGGGRRLVLERIDTRELDLSIPFRLIPEKGTIESQECGGMMRSGAQLQEIRSRLGMTTREVSERSEKIAGTKSNDEFKISIAWLTEIENSDGLPSIYKLYSLSVIYHIKFTELVLLYGIELDDIPKQRMLMPPNQTHLTPVEVYDDDKATIFPVHFDQGFDVSRTNLLSRMVDVWGEVPIGLIQHLDIRNSLYGYIGLEDFTLYPLLRPGSFVQIDQTVKRIRPTNWRSEYDRPVYFIELHDGYLCSWCELQGTRLMAVPHPLSFCSIRQYEFQREAVIVGQVTAVAMRTVNSVGRAPADAPRLTKQQ
jgi:transcriptional regulator with XRE-family HTH domain